MLQTDHHEAGAVGLFAGITTIALEGISLEKCVTAVVIAFLTGAGYKLGSVVIVNLLAKFKKKP